ncbi:hypothetical protein KR215_004416, partial [Drosophila sulfurigaster]
VSLCILCCCLLALINGQIKPIVQSENKYSSTLQIIMMYDNIFHYNNFIIYGSFYAEEGQSDGSSFIHRIMITFGKPVIMAGSETDSLHNLISTHNYAIVFFTGNCDPMLEVVQNTMRNLIFLPLLFVHKSENNLPLNVAEKEAFFKWCRKFHLYYVALITKSSNEDEIWSYFGSMPNFTMFQIKEQIIRGFNPSILGRMLGKQSTVSVYQSVPNVFVRDLTGVKKSLGGGIGIMIAELIRYVNGTLRILDLPTNIHNITIDIRANMELKTNVNSKIPFIMSTKYCMVVPYKRQISLRKYLLQIYGNWTIISFLGFYFLANVLIHKLYHRHMRLDQILFRSMEICCSQPICDGIIRNMGLAEKIIMICTMTYNLLMLALFSGALTTHITTGFYMPEIVDVDSFLVNDLRVMVPISQKKDILKYDTVPKEILSKIIMVDDKIYQHHMNSLNNNFVYIISTHKWVQFEFAQKRLRQPKLKMASEPLCGVSRYLKLPIRPELEMTYKLSDFFYYAGETGLKQKWMRMGLEQMKKANLIKQHPYDPPIFLPLSLEFFTSAFIFLLSGLTVSLVVFLFECILMRWHQ